MCRMRVICKRVRYGTDEEIISKVMIFGRRSFKTKMCTIDQAGSECKTYDLIIFDGGTSKPIQYGSGCIASYRNRLFVLSVNHVTRIRGIETYALIETGTEYLARGPGAFCHHAILATCGRALSAFEIRDSESQ